MKSEIRDAWLAALRSGDYTQTQCALHDDNGYCCLGVLSEVAQPEGWDGNSYIFTIDYEEYHEDAELPTHIANQLGLDHNTLMTLMEMNDGISDSSKTIEPVSFAVIADWIESKIPAED